MAPGWPRLARLRPEEHFKTRPGLALLVDAAPIIEHYQARGYKVLENERVRDDDGTIHHVDLLVQGRLGTLVVALEDEGGFEGPEMGSIKRIGRALGAAPVVAATRITPMMRQMARRMGVVILDANTLQHEAPTGRRTVPAAEPEESDGEAENAVPAWPDAKQAGAGEEDPATKWPDTGRSRPKVEADMEPVDVDDLLRFWSPDTLKPTSLSEQVLGHASGLWSSTRPDDKMRDDAAAAKDGRDGEAAGAESGGASAKASRQADGPPVVLASDKQPSETKQSAAGFTWLGGEVQSEVSDVGQAPETDDGAMVKRAAPSIYWDADVDPSATASPASPDVMEAQAAVAVAPADDDGSESREGRLANLTKTEMLVMALYVVVTAFLLFLLVVLFT